MIPSSINPFSNRVSNYTPSSILGAPGTYMINTELPVLVLVTFWRRRHILRSKYNKKEDIL